MSVTESIRALADVAYWSNAGWDIPGDATQQIGRLAVKAADEIDALAAKLARCEGLLRETDAALTDMVNEYAASAHTYLDISGRNADYFAEQEPRT